MSIQDLIREAKSDPSLYSAINVDALLDNAKHDFLENKTLSTVTQDVYDALSSLRISRDEMLDHGQKLTGYRFVDELYELHRGKHVRWIRIENPDRIMVGGIVVDVRFTDEGANVLCRLHNNRFTQYRFDQCLTFQKLSYDEQMVLLINGSSS